MAKQAIQVIPLGGVGEVGKNSTAIRYAKDMVLVDAGVMFPEEQMYGVDLVIPDFTYVRQNIDKLRAILLTHAHEDHIGAIPYLWPMLRCPVYATAFTAELVRNKLLDAGLEKQCPMHVVPLGGHIALGPFSVDFISITHSIPEPNALSISTPLGKVVHTGDWKLDPEPLVGASTDDARLRRLGDEGVLALVCDSTNALAQGHSGSEAKVRHSIGELIQGLEGRVAVTAFASNVARLDTIAKAARAAEREVCLVGRSMHRIIAAARASGYLKDFPALISEADAAEMPGRHVLYLVTGSQGEPRAALARIAQGQHPTVSLGSGDTVIFSSRIIPGNELAIFALHNQLASLGVEILTEQDHFVHVSGHPYRDELSEMYSWIRPKISVPVHGELRHLAEHARLARSLQVPEAVVLANGQMLRLAPGKPEIVDEVPSGRMCLDGRVLVPEGDGIGRQRRAMAFAGLIAVTLILDVKGRVRAEPAIFLEGIPDEVGGPVRAAVLETLKRHNPKKADEQALGEAVRRSARRAAQSVWAKKPVTRVEVVWV